MVAFCVADRSWHNHAVPKPQIEIRPMNRKVKAVADSTERFCKAEIDRMLKNSQTKVIMPVIALGLTAGLFGNGEGFIFRFRNS